MPVAHPYVWWRGVKINPASIPSLLVVEKLSKVPLRPVQGGYNKGVVSQSAGTHDAGAVMDFSIIGLSPAQVETLLVWLRRCGWAAWHRYPAQGFIHHIHAVRIGDSTASRVAKAQVISYRNGHIGLANNARDDGPRVGYTTWERCQYNPKNKKKKPAGKRYIVDGRDLGSANFTVSVWWLNLYRARFLKKHESPQDRGVHRFQLWLHRLGFYKQHPDGRWGPLTQKALDDFRWHRLHFRGNDAKGSVGMTTLRYLKKYGGTKPKYNDNYPIREGR